MQASSFFMGPHRTPQCVKWILWITAVSSLTVPVISYLLFHYFQLPGPTVWLPLSLAGLENGWLWQPLTYFFIQTAGFGLPLGLLFSLFFNLLLLWFTGVEVSQRYSCRTFLLFYLGAGLFAGIFASLALYFFSSSAVVVGSTPPIFALLTLWAMIYPNMDLFFFFLIRLKAKWLVAFFLGFALLLNLSSGQFIPLLADCAGILWGFLIGKFVWKLENPFPLNLDLPRKKRSSQQENKIIDINVFQESDDAFMDRMLHQISEKGEASLTHREKERMKKISERKNSG